MIKACSGGGDDIIGHVSIPYKFCPLGGSSAGLPAGYTALTAIYTNSNTAGVNTALYSIDLEYVPNAKTRWAVWAERYGTASFSNGMLYVTGTTDQRFMFSGTPTFRLFDASGTSPIGYSGKTEIVLDASTQTGSVNGVVTPLPYDTAFVFPENMTIFLFARHQGNSANYGGNGAVYGSEIYEDGVLLHKFVPAHEISSGRNGLYDVVGRKFHGNRNDSYNFSAIE